MPGNSLMDPDDALEFTPKAIEKVAHIAAALSGKRKERTICGRLAGELLIVACNLGSAEPEQQRQLRNVRKLLRDVEWICSWPTHPGNDYPCLREIAQAIPGTHSYQQAEKKILAGLLNITAGKGEDAKNAILHIQRFTKRGETNKPNTGELSVMPKSTPAGYPNKVKVLVYDVLCKHMCCTCPSEAAEKPGEKPSEKRHLARLLLRPVPPVDREGNLQIDMLFSSAPLWKKSLSVCWQDVQLLVPRVQQPSEKPTKRVRFLDRNDDAAECQAKKSLEEINDGQFCELIRLEAKARLSLTIQGGKLQRFLDSEPPEQIIENTPSISLANVLQNYHLTPKMKAALAYILAQSVWQFYDSDWMKTRWTSETIQFMRHYSHPLGKGEPNVFASKPYFSVRFGEDDVDACEATSTAGEIHRYPRVRALGIMLVEIGIGSLLPRSEKEYDEQSQTLKVNDDWSLAQQYSNLEEPWPDFDYGKYRIAVKNCLDPRIFANAPFNPKSTGKELADGLEKRRKILHDCVVFPLEELLQGTGWKDELHKIGPLQSHTRPPPVKPAPDAPSRRSFQRTAGRPTKDPTRHCSSSMPRALPPDRAVSSLRGTGGMPDPMGMEESALLGEEGGIDIDTDLRRRKKTDKWMREFRQLSVIHEIGLRGERVKVAILDSGIDYSHSDLRKNSHIKDMISWVDEEPGVDTCGHGTHIAGIILSLTENVDIYVGKVTKSKTFADKEPIAKAIKHARTNWKVDMISLSFGFEESSKSIENEIKECTSSDIAVFAAASNDGGDGDRTYPAKYDGVLCIHAATGEGNKTTFNPSPLENEDNFMVVGDCIKSSWLGQKSDGTGAKKYRSGTSFATPVAVCTAAFMIDYIREKMPDHTNWRISPNSRQGVRAIFRLMSKHRDGYGWVSPLGYFKQLPAAIEGDIRRALEK